MALDTPFAVVQCVRAVIAGDRAAAAELIEELTPVVQARVGRVLLRSGAVARACLRQEVTDYTQEAFAMLLADHARALAGWEPEAGLSLKNYVGKRVEWFVMDRLRVPEVRGVDGLRAEDMGSERCVLEHRDQLRRLFGAIEAKWPAFGVALFVQLFVLQESSKQVAATTGLASDAVDQWRSRMREFSRGFLLKE